MFLPLLRLIVSTVLALSLTGGREVSAQTPVVTLADAIELAVKNDPSLRPANDRVAVSEIQRRVAESAFGIKVAPSFGSGNSPYGLNQQSLGLSVSKRLSTGAQISLLADRTEWNAVDGGQRDFRDTGYSFNISQPLLRGAGPAATATMVTARRAVEQSGRHLREARQRTIVSVAETYFSIVRHKRLVATSELALERARRLRAASEARATVGLATQLDVLRAELLAARSEADLELQRESLTSALDLLKLSLGRSPDSLLDVEESDLGRDPFGVEAVASRPVEELVMLAIATRPDVMESREQIVDARRNQTVARWNLLPDLNLNVSYARRGIGMADAALLNDLLGGWKFGIASSYALDRTVQTAAAATAGIEMLAAEQHAIETERQVAAHVRRTHRTWLRTAESIAIQQKTLEMAEKQLRLAQLRYERGIASNFDVVDAEHHVMQAHTALIAAQVDRQLAGLSLLRAIGTLSTENLTR